MALTDAEKANFETLKRAVRNDDLALMECTDRATNERVPTLCAAELVEASEDAPEGTEPEMQFIPIAKLFTQDPYKELLPPAEGEEGDPA